MARSDATPAAGGVGLGRGFVSGHPALIVYLMAGYPDLDASLAALDVVADSGADIIELGVPYTDQLADGPVIVQADSSSVGHAGRRIGVGTWSFDDQGEVQHSTWQTRSLGPNIIEDREMQKWAEQHPQ